MAVEFKSKTLEVKKVWEFITVSLWICHYQHEIPQGELTGEVPKCAHMPHDQCFLFLSTKFSL